MRIFRRKNPIIEEIKKAQVAMDYLEKKVYALQDLLDRKEISPEAYPKLIEALEKTLSLVGQAKKFTKEFCHGNKR